MVRSVTDFGQGSVTIWRLHEKKQWSVSPDAAGKLNAGGYKAGGPDQEFESFFCDLVMINF